MRITASVLFSIFVFVLTGCGGDDVPAGGDAGVVVDAGSGDGAVSVDAGAPVDAARPDGAVVGDAGAPLDGGSSVDAAAADGGGAMADAGPPLTCSPGSAIADRLAGACDGRGRMLCNMWATMEAGRDATAQCLPPDGRCARGDTCGAAGCTCGGAPECADDQMCISVPGGGFHCACITPA